MSTPPETQRVAPKLPSDILRRVIDFVNDESPRGYGRSNSSTGSLLSLGLLCLALAPAAQAALYSSVRIRDLRQARSFLATLVGRPDLAAKVHALYLSLPRAERLDVAGAHELVAVHSDILRALAPKLRRLALDVPFRFILFHETLDERLRHPYRLAIEACAGLQELVSVQDDLYLTDDEADLGVMAPAVWSGMRELRRLALFDVDLYGIGDLVGGGLAAKLALSAASCGQRLDHLVLAYPQGFNDVDDMDLGGLLRAPNDFWAALRGLEDQQRRGPGAADPDTPSASLSRMTVLGGPEYTRGFEHNKEAEFARSAARHGVSFCFAVVDDRSPPEFYANLVITGEVWDQPPAGAAPLATA